MADSAPMLAKSLFALFMIVLLATLVAQQPPPGAVLPPSNTSLAGVTSSLTQNFPIFDNPFSHAILASTMIPNNNTAGNTRVTQGCPTGQFWRCISSDDGNASFIRSSAPVIVPFTVNMTNNTAGTGIEVSSLVFNVKCTTNATNTFRLVLTNLRGGAYPQNDAYNFECPHNGAGTNITSEDFGLVSFTLQPICTSLPANSYCTWSGLNLTQDSVTVDLWPLSATMAGETDFSFVSIDVYTTGQPLCTGSFFDQIGCQFGRAISLLTNAVVFFVNGVIFVGSIAIWFVTLLIGIGSALIGSLLWILTIPGEPPLVSGIMVGVVGMLLLIFVLAIADRVRGTGPV